MAEFKLGRIKFVWKDVWTTGTTYYVDDVVRYGGKTFICTVGHSSAANFYTDKDYNPPKWNLLTDGQAWQGDWTTDQLYAEGDVVKYGGNLYICNTSHTSALTTTTAAGTDPEDATGLEKDSTSWDVYAEGFDWKGDWVHSTRYKKNDLVKYGGYTYVCNTGHTAAATDTSGLEVNQSSWDEFNQGLEYKGAWAQDTRYKMNDVVKQGPDLWICIGRHTSSTEFIADSGNWSEFVEGIQFEDSWSSATTYQPGDIVSYGGNQYISKVLHTNAKPSSAPLVWDLFSQGYKFQNDWNNSVSYKIGEVVRLNGYTYVATDDSNSFLYSVTATTASTKNFTVLSTTGLVANQSITFSGTTFGNVMPGATYYVKGTPTATTFQISTTPGGTTFTPTTGSGAMSAIAASMPPDSVKWARLNSGISWQGTWIDDREYVLGDAVRYGSNAYICILAHRSEGDDGSSVIAQGGGAALSRPDLDATGTYWNALSIGSETSVLTTRGDLVYYGGAGPTRLPVGAEGQILRVSSTDEPEWVSLGYTDHFYYVAPHGTDQPAPISGLTLDMPWRSIRYACQQVEEGPRNPNTRKLLELNRAFIQREVSEWIQYQVANAGGTGIWNGFTYDDARCERDVGYLVDRIIWDITHGGNVKMRAAAQTYVNALSEGPYSNETDLNGTGTYLKLGTEGDNDVAAFNFMLTLVDDVINNTAPAVVYQTVNGDNSTATVAQYINTDLVAEAGVMSDITTLVDIVKTALTDGTSANIAERYEPANLISVKAGKYEETLPIIVPALTCVLGDEVRAVTAGPAGSLIDISDAAYSIAALTRLESVVSDVIVGNNVVESSGNTAVQDRKWPYASSVEQASLTRLVRAMKHKTDHDLNTMLLASYADPVGYNVSYKIGYGNARTLLKSNKEFFQAEVIKYLEINYANLKYGKTKTKRDAGYIVDALVYDLTYGGNALSVKAGLAYYDGDDDTQPQLPASIEAAVLQVLGYLKTLMQSIATDTVVTPLQTTVAQVRGTAGAAGAATEIGSNVDSIINIITTGPAAVGTSVTLTDPTPANGVNSTTALINAYSALNSAQTTIQNNVATYLSTNYSDVDYSAVKAKRDTGIVLKAVGFDFMFNSNYQTIKAAHAYLRATASELFQQDDRIKLATRNSLEYARTQAIANVGADATAIARINTLMQLVNDVIFAGSNEGSQCQTDLRSADYAALQLERNRDYIVAEMAAWVSSTYPLYTYNSTFCLRDVGYMIDAFKFDIKNPGNYKSLLATRYYVNAVKGSLEEDMFYLRNGTGVRNMTLRGLTGQLTPENEYGTSRTTAGAYCSLDPGWGPDDFRAWIVSRSPYIQNCATFGNAAIGQKVDGSLHNGGNRSFVSNDFTQLISDGIGAWVTNNARAELVSVFTYYDHIGYLSENGGRIRGTNGNNSYGDFGSVAEGYDATEIEGTAIVDNKYQFKAVVSSALTDGTQQVFAFEFENAGMDYQEASWNVTGAGIGAVAEQMWEFRDDAVYQVRLLDNVDDSTSAPEADGNFGGYGYISNANTSQGGTTTRITIAATDAELSTAYVGMRIYLDGGAGVGQYGNIATYNSGTKIATVTKESTGAAGWDHIIPGTAIVSPDASTTYVIEPRLSFTAPSYSATARTLATSMSYVDVEYAEVEKTYQAVTGTASAAGLGATFNVVRKGNKYWNAVINAGGLGYTRFETIVISGGLLGGASPANDLTITVTAINSITGAIEAFDQAGHGAGGNFIAVSAGTRTINKSSDGINWTAQLLALPSTSNWTALANGKITQTIAVLSSLVIGRTYEIVVPGNTNWLSLGSSSNLTGTVFVATGVGSGTGTAKPYAQRIVAVSSSTNVNAWSEDGGTTWSAGGAMPSAGTWSAVCYGTILNATTGTWVAVRSGSTDAAYSFDGGTTWALANVLPASTTWTGIAYGGGKFVAIASGGTQAAYSSDAQTWFSATLPSGGTWTAVTYGRGRFVAIKADSGTAGAYSLDGITWTAMTLPSATYTDVHYGQGVFLAVSQSTQAASSEDGIIWTSRTTSTAANGFSSCRFGNPNQSGVWVAVQRSTASTVATSITLGAKAMARAFVAENKIYAIKMWEPGSGYTTTPTLTITDPNNLYEAPTLVRTGKGALANPNFVNRGTFFKAASAELYTGDGYADYLQDGSYIAVRRLSKRPVAGSNVVFGSLPGQTFKLVNVLTFLGSYDGAYTAFFQVSPQMKKINAPANGTAVTTRIRYSQVRLTGHDFLDIGTGSFDETNYPGGTPDNAPNQTVETVENHGGRVFFTSTDQDGNFRVGDLFTIEQSTGIATLNADAFNIAGLQELTLGEVTLGGGSASISEFSTDPFFTQDSDSVVPTQRAIKAYISAQIGGGGASLNVNTITAGSIFIATNQISTTTGGLIQIKARMNFQQSVTGLPVAWNYFLK